MMCTTQLKCLDFKTFKLDRSVVAVSANSWEPEMPCENINKWYEENRVHYGVLLFSSFCEVNVFMKILCIIMKIKIP